MNKEQKAAAVERLRSDLGEDGHIILAEYRGLTVTQMQDLRSRVRRASGSVRVMKNTLVRKAVEGTDKDVLGDLLEGPNALVYTREDPVTVLKAAVGASKDYDAIKFKGGVVEGRSVTPEDILRIASLPSRDELLGKALGSLTSPLQGFVGVLSGLPRKLVYALNAVREAREAGS